MAAHSGRKELEPAPRKQGGLGMKIFSEEVLIEGLEMGLPIVRQKAAEKRDAEWLAAVDELIEKYKDHERYDAAYYNGALHVVEELKARMQTK